MSDFDAITAELGEERWIYLPYAVAYRWLKPGGETLVIAPEEIEIVLFGDPRLEERPRALKVVAAAEEWRDSGLADPDFYYSGAPAAVALADAVDEFRRTQPDTTRRVPEEQP